MRQNTTKISAVESEFTEITLSLDRVTRVVKGGRRFRFRALVVVGDKKGRVGMAVAKGADVRAAVLKASNLAKKNLIKIPIKRTTILFEVTGKQDGSVLLLKPAVEGTGLKAGMTPRAILELVGIGDVLSKSFGSTNKINLAYATMNALAKTAQDYKNFDNQDMNLESQEDSNISDNEKGN